MSVECGVAARGPHGLTFDGVPERVHEPGLLVLIARLVAENAAKAMRPANQKISDGLVRNDPNSRASRINEALTPAAIRMRPVAEQTAIRKAFENIVLRLGLGVNGGAVFRPARLARWAIRRRRRLQGNDGGVVRGCRFRRCEVSTRRLRGR